MRFSVPAAKRLLSAPHAVPVHCGVTDLAPDKVLLDVDGTSYVLDAIALTSAVCAAVGIARELPHFLARVTRDDQVA